MQTVSSTFRELSEADVRPISYRLTMAFDKEYEEDVDFFTVETSLIGGFDFIPGSGDVVQEWDKYHYFDFSDRLVDSIEWVREVKDYSSVTLAMADFVLDNHDGAFSPGSGVYPSEFVLPGRPVRIFAGFGDEVIPVFVGVTVGMPQLDEKAKTATFHCEDFLATLLSRPLDQSSMYIDKRTDEILAGLFSDQGILSAQLDLSVGFNRPSFAGFQKGQVLREAVLKLMEAEGGRLYMNESGVITFKNRQDYTDEPVLYLTPYKNIVDYTLKRNDEVINSVVISGAIRTEQPLQPYSELSAPIEVLPSDTASVWMGFDDPVTDADDPAYVDAATTSYFEVNSASDGSGVPVNGVTLTSSTLYSDSMELNFQNNTAQTLYITRIVIYAKPVPVTQRLYIREADSASVTQYEERRLDLENDFFQSQTDAQSKALMILHSFGEAGTVTSLNIKGTPALQIDDAVNVNLYDVVSNHRVTRIANKISQPGKYTQIITLKRLIENANYFTIELSLIGGTDQIAP